MIKVKVIHVQVMKANSKGNKEIFSCVSTHIHVCVKFFDQ